MYRHLPVLMLQGTLMGKTHLCLKVGACGGMSTIGGFMCSTDHFVPVNCSVWPCRMGSGVSTSPVEEFTCIT